MLTVTGRLTWVSLTQGTPPRDLTVERQRGQDRQNDLGSNLASCLSTVQCLVECPGKKHSFG